jgi:hypothetical protein
MLAAKRDLCRPNARSYRLSLDPWIGGLFRRVVNVEVPSVLGESGVSSSWFNRAAEGTGSETTGWVVPGGPGL